MRLLFMVNFYTSDRWGECRHTHQVLVCEDFSQVCELVKKLRLTAETLLKEKFPHQKDRQEARLSADEACHELDPLFQIIDGFYQYHVEPLVELTASEMASYRDHVWQKTMLEAKAYMLIKESLINQREGLAASKKTGKKAVSPPVEQDSPVAQALKKALDTKNNSH